MDSNLMAQIDAKVKNRSKFLADAARFYLGHSMANNNYSYK